MVEQAASFTSGLLGQTFEDLETDMIHPG